MKKGTGKGTGDVAQQKSSDALAEDPGLVLALTRKLITVCNSTSRGFNAPFWPL